MITTATPKCSTSRRSESEIASTADFDALYGARKGTARSADSELMLTMRPFD